MTSAQSERVLICAPYGRDGRLIHKQLAAAQLPAEICENLEAVCQAIQEGAGTALIADEALSAGLVEKLRTVLSNQPPWSDFPLVIMTSGGGSTEASRQRLRLLEPLGNVTLLERPLRVATLVSTMRVALRSRRRQYQLATHLAEREQHAREMVQRNTELEKANRELEEFAYVSSHDLQEPLRMVNIYTQLLTKRLATEDPVALQFAGFIHEGTARMEGLLRDLLTFSRTIQADDEGDETADLNDSLRRALSTVSGMVQENNAVILSSPLPTVPGDEAQLAQVFQNLLSNALKYRKPDVAPRISIAAERREAEWIVSVRDNGIGFDPKYAERIFGLFKRLHKDEYPGTGLGLAICQRIVERYGGRMWAESQLGHGATFSFALPAHSARKAEVIKDQDHSDNPVSMKP